MLLIAERHACRLEPYSVTCAHRARIFAEGPTGANQSMACSLIDWRPCRLTAAGRTTSLLAVAVARRSSTSGYRRPEASTAEYPISNRRLMKEEEPLARGRHNPHMNSRDANSTHWETPSAYRMHGGVHPGCAANRSDPKLLNATASRERREPRLQNRLSDAADPTTITRAICLGLSSSHSLRIDSRLNFRQALSWSSPRAAVSRPE